jgi:hypothetical protein
MTEPNPDADAAVGGAPRRELSVDELLRELDALDAIADDDDLYAKGMRCVTDHLRDWLKDLQVGAPPIAAGAPDEHDDMQPPVDRSERPTDTTSALLSSDRVEASGDEAGHAVSVQQLRPSPENATAEVGVVPLVPDVMPDRIGGHAPENAELVSGVPQGSQDAIHGANPTTAPAVHLVGRPALLDTDVCGRCSHARFDHAGVPGTRECQVRTGCDCYEFLDASTPVESEVARLRASLHQLQQENKNLRAFAPPDGVGCQDVGECYSTSTQLDAMEVRAEQAEWERDEAWATLHQREAERDETRTRLREALVNEAEPLGELPLPELAAAVVSGGWRLKKQRDDFVSQLAAAERDRAAALQALSNARIFIGYARYELEPGKSQLGDQFPRQADADVVLAEIDALLTPVRQEPKDA